MKYRPEDILAYLLVALLIARCIGDLFLVHQEDKDCRARGGVLVRTAFGAECLNATPA